jgi:hypothetical protein
MAKDRFLSDQAHEPDRSGIGSVVSSRAFKTIVLVFAAAAIGFAIVSVGSGRSMPAIQSTASAQALSPTAREAPAGDEMLAAFKAAFENKTEVDQPTAEATFNQFQAWAAKEDTQARVQPPQLAQDPRAQVAQKARAQPLPKPRPVQAAQTARAQDLSSENAQWPARIFGWGSN